MQLARNDRLCGGGYGAWGHDGAWWLAQQQPGGCSRRINAAAREPESTQGAPDGMCCAATWAAWAKRAIAFVFETIVSALCGYLKHLPIRCCPGPRRHPKFLLEVPDRIIGVPPAIYRSADRHTRKTALFSLSNPHPTTWQRIHGFLRVIGIPFQIQN